MTELHQLADTIRCEFNGQALTERQRRTLSGKFLLTLEKKLPGWRKQCEADSLLCRDLSYNLEEMANRLDALEAIVGVVLHSRKGE